MEGVAKSLSDGYWECKSKLGGREGLRETWLMSVYCPIEALSGIRRHTHFQKKFARNEEGVFDRS